MKTCKNCTLTDAVFSVRLDENGLCNYCATAKASGISAEEVAAAEKQLRKAFNLYQDRPYQVLMAYSGGKDSTFTLMKLREKYGVNVLAMTFDNGFLTERSFENAREVTSRLGVDSITIRPSLSRLATIFDLAAEKEIFPKKALERASSVCTACIGLVKSMAYKEAIIRQIPFVSFGWTPGQAPVKAPVLKLSSSMILANQRQMQTPIVDNLGEDYRPYYIEPDWLATREKDIPALIYPLVFSRYCEADLFTSIERLGWKKPGDTDTNSTNCLLNSLANEQHMRRYGFNPYSFEIAGLVREGYLSREEGLRRLKQSSDAAIIEGVRQKLEAYKAHQPEDGA